MAWKSSGGATEVLGAYTHVADLEEIPGSQLWTNIVLD